jgi:hypothetical protein
VTAAENVGIFIRERFGSKNSLSHSEEVTGWGQIRAEKQAVEGNGPHGGHGNVREGVSALFRGDDRYCYCRYY